LEVKAFSELIIAVVVAIKVVTIWRDSWFYDS